MLVKIICLINSIASWYYVFRHADGYYHYAGYMEYLPAVISIGLACSMVYLAISLSKKDD